MRKLQVIKLQVSKLQVSKLTGGMRIALAGLATPVPGEDEFPLVGT